jgi:hypothetical protein
MTKYEKRELYIIGENEDKMKQKLVCVAEAVKREERAWILSQDHFVADLPLLGYGSHPPRNPSGG